MKRKFAKLVALSCAVLMLLLALAACGNTGTSDTTTTAPLADVSTADPTLDANGYVKDDLPDTLKFTGTTVNALVWNDVEHEEFQAEENGDIVLDSIYKRNVAVENRLGVTINYIRVDGDSGERVNWNNYVGNSVKVSERQFDIIAGYSLAVTLNASSGYLFNMLNDECEYLNFEQPWWSKLLLEQATFNGKLYFASGDISRNALEMMYVCYVNTDMLADLNKPNPQEFVMSGDWTYDKFIEMCKDVYVDLDADGKKNNASTSGDQFGYVASELHCDPWFYGSGALICEKDADGNIIPSPSFGGERVINTLSKLNTLLYSTNDGIYTADATHQRSFGQGRLLFMMDRARVSHKTLAADYGELNFAILPCPKYDKDQENYITVMGNPFTLYALPRDISDPTMGSAFIECFASEGYRNVTPAVFEISLKQKYVDDPVSAELYDLIRANLTYDLGRMFSSDLLGQGSFRAAVGANSTNWASQSKAMMKQLDKLCKSLSTKLASYD